MDFGLFLPPLSPRARSASPPPIWCSPAADCAWAAACSRRRRVSEAATRDTSPSGSGLLCRGCVTLLNIWPVCSTPLGLRTEPVWVTRTRDHQGLRCRFTSVMRRGPHSGRRRRVRGGQALSASGWRIRRPVCLAPEISRSGLPSLGCLLSHPWRGLVVESSLGVLGRNRVLGTSPPVVCPCDGRVLEP